MSTDYRQPDFYRFGDEVFLLIETVIAQVDKTVESLLDVGSGCGILGLELSRRIPSIKALTLLEIQADYQSYLQDNLKRFSPQKLKTNLIINDFLKVDLTEKYDLVISNPPFFFNGQGRPSADVRRQRARSWQSIEEQKLWQAKLLNCCSQKGEVFIIHRPDYTHYGNATSVAVLGELEVLRLHK